MAIRSEIPERAPLENVEIEYERITGAKKPSRPGFNRGRLLEIDRKHCEIGAREAFRRGENLTLTMHVKGVRDFVTVEGEVQECVRITVLKQPAFGIRVDFNPLSSDQLKKIIWAKEQLSPKHKTPLRRQEPPTTIHDAPIVPQTPTQATAASPERVFEPMEAAKRPVALLQLLDALDSFEITDDLILAIVEATEAGMDVEALYASEPHEKMEALRADEELVEQIEALGTKGTARPLNVYRLASNTQLYFSETNMPVGPAADLFYLSSIESPETCFCVELGTDSMTHSNAPSFRRGSVLVFSTTAHVDTGDFAYIKTRTRDEFAQVFFDKDDEIRVRPLNPAYPEQTLRRREVRVLCKLIGHYTPVGE